VGFFFSLFILLHCSFFFFWTSSGPWIVDQKMSADLIVFFFYPLIFLLNQNSFSFSFFVFFCFFLFASHVFYCFYSPKKKFKKMTWPKKPKKQQKFSNFIKIRNLSFPDESPMFFFFSRSKNRFCLFKNKQNKKMAGLCFLFVWLLKILASILNISYNILCFLERDSKKQKIESEELTLGAGRLLKAINFASWKHKDQRRKDAGQTPYIVHPIGVAQILWEEGGVRDEAVLIVSFILWLNLNLFFMIYNVLFFSFDLLLINRLLFFMIQVC